MGQSERTGLHAKPALDGWLDGSWIGQGDGMFEDGDDDDG